MTADDFLRPIRLDGAGNPTWPLPELDVPQQDAWLLLHDGECQLNPKLAELVLRNAAERPDIALFYGDEVVHFIISLQFAQPEVRGWRLSATDYREAEWACVDG